MTPKAFQVLLVLIEKRGQVVDKDDLIQRVWPDTFVEENNLPRAISRLRKALHEHVTEHRYIVTVPGRGYCFVAAVREVANGHAAVAGEEAPLLASRSAFKVWTLVPVVAVVVVLAAVALRLVSERSAIHPPERKLWQLTFHPGLERAPTWSPDGRWIAYSSDRSGNFDIWVDPVRDGTPIRITTSSAHDSQPDWSPDGQQVAFRSERDGGGLFVVPAFGGAERKVADFGYRPRWSSDGSQILFSSSTLQLVREAPKVYVVSLNGSPPRAILADWLPVFAGPRVAWHPDGQRLSVWGQHRRSGWSFWTVSLAGDSPVKSELSAEVEQRHRDAAVSLTNAVWSPSGRALYFEGISQGVTNLWRVTVDPRTLRWIGGPDRLTTGAGLDQEIALSADGKRLAFNIHRERTRLWSLPFDAATGRIGGPGQPVTADGGDASSPDVASDGKRLVYRMVRGTKQELWARSLEDGRERLLVAADDGLSLMDPHWSSDGSHVAYRRLRGFTAAAPSPASVVLHAVDRGEERLLTTPGTRVSASDWSSDGAWMVGECAQGAHARVSLCVLQVSSAPQAERHMRVIASHQEMNLWQGRISPDDRWVSFNAINSTEANVSTIYVVPASGGQWARITEGRWFDDKPRWAPDGRTVYFMSNRAGFINVWGRRFDAARGMPVGEPFQVTRFESSDQMVAPNIGPLGMAIARDRLLLPITHLSGELWILDNVDR